MSTKPRRHVVNPLGRPPGQAARTAATTTHFILRLDNETAAKLLKEFGLPLWPAARRVLTAALSPELQAECLAAGVAVMDAAREDGRHVAVGYDRATAAMKAHPGYVPGLEGKL